MRHHYNIQPHYSWSSLENTTSSSSTSSSARIENKKNIYVKFRGKHSKNDLFPRRFIYWGEKVTVHRLFLKKAKKVLLWITSDAPMTTVITCILDCHIRSIFIFSTVLLISWFHLDALMEVLQSADISASTTIKMLCLFFATMSRRLSNISLSFQHH